MTIMRKRIAEAFGWLVPRLIASLFIGIVGGVAVGLCLGFVAGVMFSGSVLEGVVGGIYLGLIYAVNSVQVGLLATLCMIPVLFVVRRGHVLDAVCVLCGAVVLASALSRIKGPWPAPEYEILSLLLSVLTVAVVSFSTAWYLGR